MPSRLYVGNLSYSTTDETLRAFFATAGNVKETEVVMDRQMGRSKGFGFVEMMTEEEAKRAKEMLDGKILDSRPLRIDFAKPKENRPRVGAGYGAPPATGGDRPRRFNRGHRDDFRDRD
ncbi:MAG: RNA-binding protein [Anaerolineae bacterium]|nr:RNA-binding protein [Thermoflexales bacterium]MDW8408843.1 RNA-binding protein [Anaerolineae bacterium]